MTLGKAATVHHTHTHTLSLSLTHTHTHTRTRFLHAEAQMACSHPEAAISNMNSLVDCCSSEYTHAHTQLLSEDEDSTCWWRLLTTVVKQGQHTNASVVLVYIITRQLNIRAQQICPFADIIYRYWSIADKSVLACIFSDIADIETVFLGHNKCLDKWFKTV